jgi:hypothetical protein
MIRFLAMHTPAGGDTLETGAGLTTVLFAALDGRHLSITPDRGESDRILAFCRGQGTSTDSLKFVTAGSEDALPTLNAPRLDLVLIAGGHGFPMPVIDWYYTASKLKLGSNVGHRRYRTLVVRSLGRFPQTRPTWAPVGPVSRRTFAFRKVAPFEYKEFSFRPYVVRESRFRSLAKSALTTWDRIVADCRSTSPLVKIQSLMVAV